MEANGEWHRNMLTERLNSEACGELLGNCLTRKAKGEHFRERFTDSFYRINFSAEVCSHTDGARRKRKGGAAAQR